jgi:hypothetical protein
MLSSVYNMCFYVLFVTCMVIVSRFDQSNIWRTIVGFVILIYNNLKLLKLDGSILKSVYKYTCSLLTNIIDNLIISLIMLNIFQYSSFIIPYRKKSRLKRV